jgi:hypothetical protein
MKRPTRRHRRARRRCGQNIPVVHATLRLAQPSRLGDAHAGDLDRVSDGPHALSFCGRETHADQLDQQLDGEAMRQHDRLGRALAGPDRRDYEQGAQEVIAFLTIAILLALILWRVW